MVTSTKENGKKVSKMELEHTMATMNHFIKENTKTIRFLRFQKQFESEFLTWVTRTPGGMCKVSRGMPDVSNLTRPVQDQFHDSNCYQMLSMLEYKEEVLKVNKAFENLRKYAKDC